MNLKNILIIGALGVGALFFLGGKTTDQPISSGGGVMDGGLLDEPAGAQLFDFGNLFGSSNQEVPQGFFDSAQLTKKQQTTELFTKAGMISGQQSFAPTSSDASLYAQFPIVKGGAPLQVVSTSTTRFVSSSSGLIPYSVAPSGSSSNMTKKEASSIAMNPNVQAPKPAPTQQNILQGLKKL